MPKNLIALIIYAFLLILFLAISYGDQDLLSKLYLDHSIINNSIVKVALFVFLVSTFFLYPINFLNKKSKLDNDSSEANFQVQADITTQQGKALTLAKLIKLNLGA